MAERAHLDHAHTRNLGIEGFFDLQYRDDRMDGSRIRNSAERGCMLGPIATAVLRGFLIDLSVLREFDALNHMPEAGDILLCDSTGIVDRARTDLNPYKREIAETTNRRGMKGSLADALQGADVFIGLSQPNIVTEEMLWTMNPQPIVFAMANPVPEIMPHVARAAGAVVVATGRRDFPNQINNVLAFPGVFRGALDAGARVINEEMKVAAAQTLASIVIEPVPERILPDPLDKSVGFRIGEAVAAAARKSGVCRN